MSEEGGGAGGSCDHALSLVKGPGRRASPVGLVWRESYAAVPGPPPHTRRPPASILHRSAYLIRDVVDEMSLSGLRPDRFILQTGASPPAGPACPRLPPTITASPPQLCAARVPAGSSRALPFYCTLTTTPALCHSFSAPALAGMFACMKNRKLGDAMYFFEEMKRRGMPMDVSVAAVLSATFCSRSPQRLHPSLARIAILCACRARPMASPSAPRGAAASRRGRWSSATRCWRGAWRSRTTSASRCCTPLRVRGAGVGGWDGWMGWMGWRQMPFKLAMRLL